VELIGRYRVTRLIGRGGVAEVYLARDPALERDVAIKLLYADPTRRGLRDEAKALASLRHPGVVTIYEIGEHAGREYIAMEYLPGRTLRQAMTAGDPREVLVGVCSEVASALVAAHAAGILHRDVKPENVVVADGGAVVVVDFGIARRLRSERPPRAMTAEEAAGSLASRTLPYGDASADTVVNVDAQTPFGTPAYMAPEVLIGDESTAASDVYSLGVVVFECLAGRRPHSGGDLVTAISQVIDEDAPVLDDPLGALVARMLARSPADRPGLAEVAKALAREVARYARATTKPTPVDPTGHRHPAAPRGPASSRELPVLPPVAKGTPVPADSRTRSPRARAPRSRAPIVVAVLAVAAAVVAGGLYAHARWRAAAEPVPLGIEPVVAHVPSDGYDEDPDPRAVAGALAVLLAQASPVAAAVDDGTYEHVATVAIREVGSGGDVEGIVWIRERAGSGGLVSAPSRTLTAHGFAPLLDAIAIAIARDLGDPGAALAMPSRPRGQQLARLAEPLLDTGRFGSARPYLELAVDADPTLFETWFRLILVRMWQGLAAPIADDMFAHALAAAPDAAHGELVRAAQDATNGEFARARRRLEPLLQRTEMLGRSSTETDRVLRADVEYLAGEAEWHDGDYAAGAARFRALLDVTPQRYRASAVHAWQFEVAHRDAIEAARYLGLVNGEPEIAQLAAGDYARVASAARQPFAMWAQRLLDQPLSAASRAYLAESDITAHWLEHVGELVAAGDLAGAHDAIAARREVREPGEDDYHALEELGELELAAGLDDDARALVAMLATKPTRLVRGYQRLTMLAAAATGDRALIIAGDDVGARARELGAAAAAKLDGRLADAVALYREVIADPSPAWEYPERAELIRDLRTLGRTADAQAVCDDTLHPPVYRVALAALRRLCH
jgi:serine/threonine protein kinase